MAKVLVNDTSLQGIANSIRNKNGTQEKYKPSEMPQAILDIPSGTDTSDANAAASDVLENKTAYVKGSKITGNIPNNGSINITPATTSQSIPTGYTSGGAVSAVTSSIDNNIQASNIKSGVSILGVTGNVVELNGQTKNITPSTSAQTITPDTGYNAITQANVSAVTSSIDNNITAENIKKDVSILGVTGTYEGGGGINWVDEKDVNFYEYDGTLLYSYTADEFAQLSSMPATPVRQGFTSQGWNWSLEDAKPYVASYGGLDIGHTCITSDGKTRVYITLTEGLLELCVQFYAKNNVTISWGDGTDDTTLTGDSSDYSYVYSRHTYSAEGDYVMTFTPAEDGYMRIQGNSGSSYTKAYLIAKSPDTSLTKADSYGHLNTIKKVEIGSHVSFQSYAFALCSNLRSINIPTGVWIPTYMFYYCTGLECLVTPTTLAFAQGSACYYCYSLKTVCLPKTALIFYNYCFAYCYSLKRIQISASATNLYYNIFRDCHSFQKIIIPSGITTLGEYAFYSCRALSKVIFQGDITAIEQYSMNGCSTLKILDLSNCTSVPTIGTNAISTHTGLKIIVPDDLYDTWKTTTGWTSYANYIVKKSQA